MSSEKPKRRWYQFSLKTLLTAMVTSTIFVGWIGLRMQRARVNRATLATSEKPVRMAVAAIEKLGGGVTSGYEKLRPQTWLEKQFDDPGGADDPVRVFKVTRATVVNDAGLEHVRKLTDLHSLYLADTQVTDAGLEHLHGMTHLQVLGLHRIRVTGVGMDRLRQALPNCQIGAY